MTENGNPASPERLAYNLDEVARLLGGVNRRYVEDLVAARKEPRLRSIKLGRRRMVTHADLEAFLAELRRNEEIARRTAQGAP